MLAAFRRVTKPLLVRHGRKTFPMAHRIFSIPELCAAIVDPISAIDTDPPYDDDYWENSTSEFNRDTEAKLTLAALARVSRNFNEPAVTALWMRLHHVVPLLRLLPEDVVWVEHRVWTLVGKHANEDLEVRA